MLRPSPDSRSAGGRWNALREKSAYYGTSAHYTIYGASSPYDPWARRDHEFQGGVEPWPRPRQCYGSDLMQTFNSLQSYILEPRFDFGSSDLYPSRLCLVLHDLTGEVQTFRQSASPMIHQCLLVHSVGTSQYTATLWADSPRERSTVISKTFSEEHHYRHVKIAKCLYLISVIPHS